MASESKKAPPRSKLYKYLRWGILGFIGFFTLAGLITVGMVLNDLPPMNDIENPQLDISTQIYSADGKKMGSMHDGQDRDYMHMDSMSHWVKDALLATEDVRFYNHSGIDPRTPFTIVKDMVFHFRLRGGSSISQQLARNLYNQVGRENSVGRKAKEAIVAIVLESRFTKDEIIAAYLNTTTFYGNTFGIENGAQTLFSKSARDLELHEAALLIGLLKGPGYYNPRRYPERAINRRNTVLEQMLKYDFITDDEAKEAKDKDLELKFRAGGTSTAMAGYFKDQVKSELIAWKESTNQNVDLYRDGLRVYTTLDSRMQHYAERAVNEHLSQLQVTFEKELKRGKDPFAENPTILPTEMKRSWRWKSSEAAGMSDTEIKESFKEPVSMRLFTWDKGMVDTVMTPLDSIKYSIKFLQTGFMSMDPKTGEIKSWVGGIGYEAFKYDHVRQGKRQVGSTFKPFVYTALFESGLAGPCDKVLDAPIAIDLPDGRQWRPQNSGGGDMGLITYYEGLARSINKATAAAMKKVGPEAVCRTARRLGIESKLECVYALALGTSDVSVYEMVGAYSALANHGTFTKPYLIKRIEDKNGNVLYEHKAEAQEAVSPNTAFAVIRMMQGVVDHPGGTASRLRGTYHFRNQIAGKTGTTQNNSDGWFIGATPNLVSGAWVGCDDRRLRFSRTAYGQGANMALPIWAIYMKYVYADKDIDLPEDPFIPPNGYTEFMCPTKAELVGQDSTGHSSNIFDIDD
jgi:penicillin-binding protein 1A